MDDIYDLLYDETDVNIMDADAGRSALHWAVLHGQTQLAKALLEAGAVVNTFAKVRGGAVTVHAVVAWACTMRAPCAANRTCVCPPPPGWEAPIIAGMSHVPCTQVAPELLQRPARACMVHCPTPHARTCARACRHTRVRVSVCAGALLLQDGTTPLMAAVRKGGVELASMLLCEGAHCDLINQVGAARPRAGKQVACVRPRRQGSGSEACCDWQVPSVAGTQAGGARPGRSRTFCSCC